MNLITTVLVLVCLSMQIGYVYGNPRNWPFDGWIKQSPNVIIVSVYYRLDSFGFLASSVFRRMARVAGLQLPHFVFICCI